MSSSPQNVRKNTIFWIITLAIPVILLVLVEMTFRLVGIGEIPPLFKEVQINNENYLMPNRDFAQRYFKSTNVVPTASNDVFKQVKGPNTFRVFALGGSSMAGFPYHYNGMMSHVVRDVLEDGFPKKNIEVINLGISAINSYTIYDMLNEVLVQKPDLLLFYAGHNEYYGALGVGSSESISNYPALVRLYLNLQHLRTFVVFQESLASFIGLISGPPDKGNATLMEQMVKEQKIELDSDNYEAGINQFADNLNVIVAKSKEQNIPIILGSLVSNLKDFAPFISLGEGENNAAFIFDKAQEALANNEGVKAKELFTRAKDLDALRFRAPSELNKIIAQTAQKYQMPTADIESIFTAFSPKNIADNALMLEHLHPNTKGYFLLGWAYANEVTKHLQKNNADWQQSNVKSQSQYEQMMALSSYDKRVAAYRIASIQAGWPFQEPGVNLPYLNKFPIQSLSDSLALENFLGKVNWQATKEQLASHYLGQQQLDLALLELNGILRAFPWRVDVLEKKASILNEQGNSNLAIKTLIKANKQLETVFNTKILGALLLQTNRLDQGLPYLERAYKLQPNDAQNLYNLSGAYGIRKDFAQARIYANKLLSIAPNFPGAQQWNQQLLQLENAN
jgi:lysophospholipase L1-like esterase